ncbi:E2F-associated phosphoprotein-like [Zophobas morio]|uniref:E2F-associated phosphoprotein-like n=1 Tax=Zophobas morio TaxID=2755281 RepID=UPI00308363F9
MDNKDALWVLEKRKEMAGSSNYISSVVLSNSDAVLNCPSCLCLISLDCQRHEKYKTQYRAMFVLNCTIVLRETLRFTPKGKKEITDSNKDSNKLFAKTKNLQVDEYHPVRCSLCHTEVGIYDWEEVYHFFNVLASEP